MPPSPFLAVPAATPVIVPELNTEVDRLTATAAWAFS